MVCVWCFCVDKENDEISMSLVKMNDTIPYFGLSDLMEILGKSVLGQ